MHRVPLPPIVRDAAPAHEYSQNERHQYDEYRYGSTVSTPKRFFADVVEPRTPSAIVVDAAGRLSAPSQSLSSEHAAQAPTPGMKVRPGILNRTQYADVTARRPSKLQRGCGKGNDADYSYPVFGGSDGEDYDDSMLDGPPSFGAYGLYGADVDMSIDRFDASAVCILLEMSCKRRLEGSSPGFRAPLFVS
jgi:hypothetical protein